MFEGMQIDIPPINFDWETKMYQLLVINLTILFAHGDNHERP